MKTSKTIVEILRPHGAHWVGDGFPVRTLFAVHGNDPALISPFLLFDYAGPQEFPPDSSGQPRGVDEHPHRGFETVTIVYQGALEHRDSAGNAGSIGPGDVQWMTAASGVVHEEKHEREFTKRGGTFEVVQLWVNLPAREKMAKPRYQELRGDIIPVVALPSDAGSVRIIAGEFQGTRGPAKTVMPMSVWDVRLRRGADLSFSLPGGWNALVAALRGRVIINSAHAIASAECAALSREGDSVSLRAEEPATLVILAGQPIDEPVAAHGPFVMNTRAEINQAKMDFQSGKMGRLPAPVRASH